MEWLAIAIVTVWFLIRLRQNDQRAGALSERLSKLESEIRQLKREPPTVKTADVPLKPVTKQEPEPVPARVDVASNVSPSPSPFRREPEPTIYSKRSVARGINWEHFMGVKLFAWIGGLALFFGIAFFVKYSFDNNLISPELRMTIGFLAGVGLVSGGVLTRRRQYQTLSQTLCATGIAVLYAVTFACRSIYHFELFSTITTFCFMALITASAFVIAVRMDALVVAVLGMLGGFLTPILLSTGQDNPLGLFGYIAILDIGLILVALHRRWFFLTALAACGTATMAVGWTREFFIAERYFDGNNILIPLAVLLVFNLLYSGAVYWSKVRGLSNPFITGSAIGLAVTALGFVGYFLSFPNLADRPMLMFGFVFLIDIIVTAVVLLDRTFVPAQSPFGLIVFMLLAGWTVHTLNTALLNTALTFYFVFAVLHSGFPVFLRRRFNVETPAWMSQCFPPLALILVLMPLFQLPEITFLIWPIVLLLDVLAISIAVMSSSILPVIGALLLTFAGTGVLILRIPDTLDGLATLFILLSGFSIFFIASGQWLIFKVDAPADGSARPEITEQLPVMSAVLPFLLLIMATLRLPFPDPTPVFGVALLLIVLMLGVTRLFSMPQLAPSHYCV